MAKKLYPDKWLFAATVGLALFGVVMVYSASAMLAISEKHGQFFYVKKQALWTAIGLVAMVVAMQFDYNRLRDRRIVYGLLLLTTMLLVAVFAFPPNQRRTSLDSVQRVFTSAFGNFEAGACDLPRVLP